MKPPAESVLAHPFRQHFIRREFAALDGILQNCAGKYCIANELSLADCFLVPQVRNAFGAEDLDIEFEFPTIFRVWSNCLAVPAIASLLEDCGGIVKPLTSKGISLRVGKYAHDDGSTAPDIGTAAIPISDKSRIAGLEAMMHAMNDTINRIEASTHGMAAMLSAETAKVSLQQRNTEPFDGSGLKTVLATRPCRAPPSTAPIQTPTPTPIQTPTSTPALDQGLERPPNLDPSINLRQVRANGISMRIAECGNRDARHCCLLLHGWPESWYSWRKQLPALAKAGYYAIAPDTRGYGGTEGPKVRNAVRAVAE
jgi:hypothetical protein